MDEPWTCCCAPTIVWAQDADRTWLVDQGTGQSWVLRGQEAVIWDWLRGGYSYDRIVRMLALILASSEEASRQTLVRVLQGWQDAGIVQLDRNGEPDDQRGL